MSTLAQRNVAAFKAMKRSHSVSVGGTKLEIQPPGILKIMERIEAEVPVETVLALAEGNIPVQEILRQFPRLSRWLAVESLGTKASADELEEIQDFVGSLSIEELLDLADGIVDVLMPEVENIKKKGLSIRDRIGLKVNLEAAE